jgi:hypothetical protein
VRTRSATLALVAALVALGACGSDPTPVRTETSPPAERVESPSATAPSPSFEAASPSPSEPSPPPSPSPEPLGASRARFTVTGDIQATAAMDLAMADSFSATWCDARDCGKAANSLQLMGQDLSRTGAHRTSGGLIVTIEVDDRFLFVSGDQYTQGSCTVTLSVADERGYAGQIVCRNITNGTGIGILTVSVRGTFVAEL